MKALNIPIQKELLSDSQELRLILDAADIPINYCGRDLTFLFVNKAYASWYNRTPEQIIGKSLIELLGREGHETIRPYYERALRGENFRYETDVNLSIGFRHVECHYTPVFNEHNAVTGWVGIVYDMTERHFLERKLQQNQAALILAKEKAESASIAKSEFLANMSHEIRTPMNAVLGLAYILSVTAPQTPKQKEMISTLQLSAQSLLSLINDLLDFSKIESRGLAFEAIPSCFSSIIGEIISMLKVEAEKKEIVIEYAPSDLDETLFMCDPMRVRQILVNLVGNALKFTQRGKISVRLSSTPHADANRLHLHIAVKDTGIGIAADKIATVFDKFVQADMSITRKYGGSGLGLAISKNLAELMGGSITVESLPGEGSEFTLHLPLEYARKEDAASTSPSRQESPAAATDTKITLLLAEDNTPNILVAMSMLERMGHRCHVARTGKEVLEKMMGQALYDIILMDVQMPELDGFVTARLIRENERKEGRKRIPIIAVTAHTGPEYLEKCRDAGMDDFLTKPFDFDDLKRKILALVPH